MKAAHILVICAAAGAIGAAAGAVATLGRADRTTAADDPVLTRLDALADGVDDLRSSLRESRDRIADVDERLVGAELELSRRAEAEARVPVVEIGVPRPDEHGVLRDVVRPSPPPPKLTTEAADALVRSTTKRQEKFARAMELRALSDDDFWTRAEQDLRLSNVQIDEIKNARADLDAAVEAATTTKEIEIGGGRAITRHIDGNKTREARKTFDERVGQLLDSEQKKTWNDDGWKEALSRSGPGRFRPRVGGGSGSGPVRSMTIEVEESKD